MQPHQNLKQQLYHATNRRSDCVEIHYLTSNIAEVSVYFAFKSMAEDRLTICESAIKELGYKLNKRAYIRQERDSRQSDKQFAIVLEIKF